MLINIATTDRSVFLPCILSCTNIYHVYYNTTLIKKDQHRSCHTAKYNMLHKWLKTKKKSILVTHTFSIIHLKHDLFKRICTNISHTHTTTYAHMQPTTKSGKIKCCHLANIEYFLLRLRVLPPGEYHVIHTPMP